MCTRNQALEILDEVYRSCLPIYNNRICDAFLYGSYARGNQTNESDIDIMLTVDMQTAEIAEQRTAIASVTSNLSLKYDVTVSVTVKSIEQFEKYSDILPYYKKVLSEGIRYAVLKKSRTFKCKDRALARMLKRFKKAFGIRELQKRGKPLILCRFSCDESCSCF